MPKFNKVLLVEDDPITVLVCERIIKMTGFSENVVSVNNGQEALDYINAHDRSSAHQLPDLIFLDINMPLMNGWEFLDHFGAVKSVFQNLPLIYILSSTVDPEDQKKGSTYPYISRFISKPLTKDDLENISLP